MKQLLEIALILTIPTKMENFIIYNDASKNELGCMFMQNNKVIAYAFWQLKEFEKNYPTYYLKLVAMVFSLKIWKHYLYGKRCQIYTNYKTLNIFLHKKDMNMWQRWWFDLVKDYDCDINDHSSKGNLVVDVFSRETPRNLPVMITTQKEILRNMKKYT